MEAGAVLELAVTWLSSATGRLLALASALFAATTVIDTVLLVSALAAAAGLLLSRRRWLLAVAGLAFVSRAVAASAAAPRA